MKTRSLIALCLLMIVGTFQVQAQAPEWSRLLQVPSYGLPGIPCVVANKDYVALAGAYSAFLDFDGTTMESGNLRDLFVQLSLVWGDKIWNQQFSSTGSLAPTAIQIDEYDNVYVSGPYSGEATFGAFTLSGGNSFLVKIDVNGKVQWAVSQNTLSSSPRQIEVDGYGNCYLASFSDQLIKYNHDGIHQWTNPLPTNVLRSMSVSGDYLYLGGNLPTGSMSIGPFNFTKSFRTGIIVQLSNDGSYRNYLEVGKASTGYGSGVGAIENDSRGNLVFTGYYFETLEFNGDIWATKSNTSYPYIAMCDPSLKVQWAQSGEFINYANPLSFKLFLDGSDGVYLYCNSGGFWFNGVNVQPGWTLLRCDALGNPLETAGLNNSVSAISVSPYGDYYQTGLYSTDTPDLMNNVFIRKFTWPDNLEWQKISTGSLGGSFRFNFGVHDGSGNLFTSGKYAGFTDYFGTQMQAPGQRTLLSRIDPSGRVAWSRSIADINSTVSSYPFGQQVAVDPEGNMVTTGRFDTQLKLGGYTLVNQNLLADGYVARFSPEGEVDWVTQLHSTANCNLDGVAVDHNGSVVVTGTFSGILTVDGFALDAGPGDAVFILKLGHDGGRTWLMAVPAEELYFAIPAVDPDGNIFVACEMYNHSTGIIDFGGVTCPQGPDDGGTVLAMIDPTGSVRWVNTYGGSALDAGASGWPTAIQTDTKGNCTLWGWCFDQAVFGGKTFTNPLTVVNTRYNFYVTKIDPTGAVLWADVVFEKNYGFNYGPLLDLDNEDNVYVGGHFRDTIEVSGNRFKPETPNDFFMIKYSHDGNYQWIKTLPTGGTNFSCLSVLKDNSVTIGGINGALTNVGPFLVTRKGGPTGVLATLGDLLPHFVPVWSGNGVDQMNLNITSALLDGLDLEHGDEIGVFDGELCVGAGVVDQTITSDNLLNLVVSRNDGTGNGYTPGHPITYRYFDLSASREVTQVTATYDNENPEWSTSGIFEAGATAFAALNGESTSLLTLSLKEGWNLISSNVTPAEPDMEVVFWPLISSSWLVKVMDEAGNSLEDLGDFGGWQNTIGDLALTEGYKVKVTTDCRLNLEGESAPLPMDIPLTTGWNIIGFPYPWSINALDLMQQLITRGTLIKVQDETGRSIEDYGTYGGWVNNIGSFQPGKGYKVRVNAPDVLNLPALVYKSAEVPLTEVAPRHFIPVYRGNGVDHMNINLVGLPAGFLQPGDEIGLFDGGLCVGAVTLLPRHFNARLVSIPASAADRGDNQGFTEGNPIHLQLWKASTGALLTLDPEVIKGSTSFRKNESLFASLEKYAITPAILPGQETLRLYPNPTSGKITITTSGGVGTKTEVLVMNPAGQRVLDTILETNPGEIDLSGNAPGLYYIRVTSGHNSLTEKITLR